jgi:hypothetical protein
MMLNLGLPFVLSVEGLHCTQESVVLDKLQLATGSNSADVPEKIDIWKGIETRRDPDGVAKETTREPLKIAVIPSGDTKKPAREHFPGFDWEEMNMALLWGGGGGHPQR